MDSTTESSPSELGVQILQNCLAELLSLFPHLDSALASLRFAADADMEGIGTDGETIRFSPGLLRQYRDDPAAVRRGYLHMLLHCLCFHPFTGRRGRQWDMAADMAVEQMIQREAIPRLALKPDPVRDASLRFLSNEARSAEELCEMLEQGVFPFSQEELEAAFRFDSHALWNRDGEKSPAGLRKWKRFASGAGRGGGGRPGRTAGSGAEILEVPRQGVCDYRRFLRQFTVQREEVLLDTENFDLVLYSFGMERYGNLPLIEPLEYQEVSRLEELVIAIDTSGSCSADPGGDLCHRQPAGKLLSEDEGLSHPVRLSGPERDRDPLGRGMAGELRTHHYPGPGRHGLYAGIPLCGGATPEERA